MKVIVTRSTKIDNQEFEKGQIVEDAYLTEYLQKIGAANKYSKEEGKKLEGTKNASLEVLEILEQNGITLEVAREMNASELLSYEGMTKEKIKELNLEENKDIPKQALTAFEKAEISLEDAKNMTFEEIVKVKGIGEKLAKQFLDSI